MNFFDNQPVLYPWPQILRTSGFKYLYKPREVWWRGWIKKLNLKKREKALDVGCGGGVFLARLVQEYGIKGWGIDASEKSIIRAKKNSLAKLNLQTASAIKLPFKNNYFDVVLSFDVLEHIKEQKKAVLEMIRVLKPGGRLLIYTINKKQFLTWNWWLSKLGIDIYKRSDHKKELLVDSLWLKDTLVNRGIKIKGRGYFNSFFSLAADEMIMIFLTFWQKYFGWENQPKFARIVLGTLTVLAKVLTPVFKVLELPWTIFGLSNGVLFMGRKNR